MTIENDFGFSFVDEQAIKDSKDITIKELQQKHQEKLNQVLMMITPLLDNLMANPERKTINWPNRYEKVTEFKKKLTDFIEKE